MLTIKTCIQQKINTIATGNHKFLLFQRHHDGSKQSWNETDWLDFMETIDHRRLNTLEQHPSGKQEIHLRWTDIYDGPTDLPQYKGRYLVPIWIHVFFQTDGRITINFNLKFVTEN